MRNEIIINYITYVPIQYNSILIDNSTVETVYPLSSSKSCEAMRAEISIFRNIPSDDKLTFNGVKNQTRHVPTKREEKKNLSMALNKSIFGITLMEHKVHRLNWLLVEQINRADSNFNVLDFRPEEIFSSVRVAESALRFILLFLLQLDFWC